MAIHASDESERCVLHGYGPDRRKPACSAKSTSYLESYSRPSNSAANRDFTPRAKEAWIACSNPEKCVDSATGTEEEKPSPKHTGTHTVFERFPEVVRATKAEETYTACLRGARRSVSRISSEFDAPVLADNLGRPHAYGLTCRWRDQASGATPWRRWSPHPAIARRTAP